MSGVAADCDHDALSCSLVEQLLDENGLPAASPAGMTIEPTSASSAEPQTGVIRWTPSDFGLFSVSVRVTDVLGQFCSCLWDVPQRTARFENRACRRLAERPSGAAK